MSAQRPQCYRSALRAEQRRKVAQIVGYAVVGAILGALTFYAGVWAERLTAPQVLTLDLPQCQLDYQLPTLDHD